MPFDRSLVKSSCAEFDLLASLVSVTSGRTPRTSAAHAQTLASLTEDRPSFPLTAGPITTGLLSADREPYVISTKLLIGLYCMYALVGLVNGFLVQNITKPFCLYVFDGVQNDNVKYAQCNIAPTILQMPWNFKVFYGLFLDRTSLCGSRRYGWIVAGWGIAIGLLVGISFVVDDLVINQDFTSYNLLLMLTCFFYIFADVSADGFIIELSQYEPEARRGYILTTGQMVRFGTTALSLLASTFFLNGPQMYPPGMTNKNLFSFGLSLKQVHWAIAGIAAPLFLVMVVCLKDPPAHGPHNAMSYKETATAVWTTLQSRAMLSMILFNIGFIAIAGLTNPAASAVASIVVPSPMQVSLSALAGKVLFLYGVWLFRRYFMNKNWRITCLWTNTLMILEGLFYMGIIYNIGGFMQSGSFYCFGDVLIYIVQGIAQVLSSLAVVEIAKPGLEATTYELLTTMHNCAIAFNANIGNSLMSVFDINSISHSSYAGFEDLRDKFDADMRNCTLTTIAVQVGGTLIFTWLLPANKDMCREWRDDSRYHTRCIGIAGLIIGVSVFFYSTILSFFSLFPSTRCLQIAGGDGC